MLSPAYNVSEHGIKSIFVSLLLLDSSLTSYLTFFFFFKLFCFHFKRTDFGADKTTSKYTTDILQPDVVYVHIKLFLRKIITHFIHRVCVCLINIQYFSSTCLHVLKRQFLFLWLLNAPNVHQPVSNHVCLFDDEQVVWLSVLQHFCCLQWPK